MRFTVDEARDLLTRVGVFFDADPDDPDERKWSQTLNLNDTFAWACADSEYVSDEDLPEVASLFFRYGRCGILYWVNRKRDGEKVEFLDVQRLIAFVAHEEQLRKDVPRSSERAYHNLSYTLGVPPQWWGVWCEREGGPSFWREGWDPGAEGPEPWLVTETEARRTADRLNSFAAERTDSIGWKYTAMPYDEKRLGTL